MPRTPRLDTEQVRERLATLPGWQLSDDGLAITRRFKFADFQQAFGEAPGALLSIGIMTDSDNTASTASAWYGPVRHVKRP